MSLTREHISVCILTFKRPAMLAKLLGELQHQVTDCLFIHSIITWYNLNGVNAGKNPGAYEFIEGLCGGNGKDVYPVGNNALLLCSGVVASISE
jgi:hypothetical protein